MTWAGNWSSSQSIYVSVWFGAFLLSASWATAWSQMESSQFVFKSRCMQRYSLSIFQWAYAMSVSLKAVGNWTVDQSFAGATANLLCNLVLFRIYLDSESSLNRCHYLEKWQHLLNFLITGILYHRCIVAKFPIGYDWVCSKYCWVRGFWSCCTIFNKYDWAIFQSGHLINM